jgi:glycosyltransferase involved in cell wall biosynthesis
VTTEANGAAELLQNGVNGCVLGHVPSAEALANALRWILLSREQRQAMGEAAYHTAREYPLSRALTSTLQLYEFVAYQAMPVGQSEASG